MITLLETLVDGADGAYASKQDIRNLEHVMFSWAERKEAYQAVQDKEKVIIDRAINSIQSSKTTLGDWELNPGTLNRCRRDMTLALRAYALGMLLQDEEMLKDRFLYWQKSVLQAMGLHNYQGTKFVFESLCVELKPEQAELFKPYFKIAQELVMSN